MRGRGVQPRPDRPESRQRTQAFQVVVVLDPVTEPLAGADGAIQQVEGVVRFAGQRVEAGCVVQRAEVIRPQAQRGLDIAPPGLLVAQAQLQPGGEVARAPVLGIHLGFRQREFQRAPREFVGARAVAHGFGRHDRQRQRLELVRTRAMRGFEFIDGARILAACEQVPCEIVVRLVQAGVERDRARERLLRSHAGAVEVQGVGMCHVRLGQVGREFQRASACRQCFIEHIAGMRKPPQQ